MSPAERMQAQKKHQRKKLSRLRKALKAAEYCAVDIADDMNFGVDVHGNEIDMDGCFFLPVEHYPAGIVFSESEVGAFIEQNEQHDVKAPLRILHQGGILSEALQRIADSCTDEERDALLETLH